LKKDVRSYLSISVGVVFAGYFGREGKTERDAIQCEKEGWHM